MNLDLLKLSHDPFGPEATAFAAAPVQSAFEEAMRAITAGARLIVIAGPAGSGRTLLLDMIESAVLARESWIRRASGDDVAQQDAPSDVVLVDDADSGDVTQLQALLSPTGEQPSGTVVVACSPKFATRFGGTPGAAFVKLTALTPGDARNFILERVRDAGRFDLFMPDALDRLIVAGAGLPRLLLTLGGLALDRAAAMKATQITPWHVSDAVARHAGIMAPEPEPVVEPIAEAAVIPPADAASPLSFLGFVAARPRFRREAVAAVLVIGVVAFPLLFWGSKSDSTPQARIATPSLVAVTPAAQAHAIAALVPVKRGPPVNALHALEHVAAAALPGPVILAVLTPSPLQELRIKGSDAEMVIGGKSQVVSGSPARATPAPSAPTQKSAPAKPRRAVTRNASRAIPPATRVAQAERPASVRAVPRSTLPRAPTRAAVPVQTMGYLSDVEMLRIMSLIGERAGFGGEEFAAFRDCVLNRIGGDEVQAEEFRNALRRCGPE